MNLIEKMFGTHSEREIKRIQPLVDKIEALRTQQEAGTAQDLALTKSIKALSEGQASQNKLLASMQTLILEIASQKQATPTQPTTDNQATGKQENGGN